MALDCFGHIENLVLTRENEEREECRLTSPRAFVVEKNPVDRIHVVGFSEVHHNPEGIEFSNAWEQRREDRNSSK